MFLIQGQYLLKQKAPLVHGTVFRENFATLANWTSVGGGSFTPNASTGLTIGAGTLDYTKYITYDPLVNTCEEFVMFCQVEVLAVGILSMGVETERLVAGSHRKSFMGSWIGGATTGRVVIATYADGTSTTVTNVADAQTFGLTINYSVGQILNFSFRRTAINTYVSTIFNTNTGLESSVQYNEIPDSSPSVVAANNATKFKVHCISGSYRVIPGTFVVSSDAYRNVRAVFCGDSRTTFMSASPATNRFANITFGSSKYNYVVNAGAYDTAGQYSTQGTWINSIGADYAIICGLMRNGVFYGIAQATNRANYTSIRDNARAGGAKVVHILFPSDASATMTTENSWVVSTFTQDIIIDLSGETYTYADGVHFTNADHAAIGASIRAAMPYLY